MGARWELCSISKLECQIFENSASYFLRRPSLVDVVKHTFYKTALPAYYYDATYRFSY